MVLDGCMVSMNYGAKVFLFTVYIDHTVLVTNYKNLFLGSFLGITQEHHGDLGRSGDSTFV
jgi:hypothetical protein